MKVKRSLRVAELIKRDLSLIIANRVRNEEVREVLITYVKVSDDLKHAKVYYRILNQTAEKQTIANALIRVTGFLRTELGRTANLRYVPELNFFYDYSFDEANKIDLLIDKIKHEAE